MTKRIGSVWLVGYIASCAVTVGYGLMWGTPAWIGAFSYGMG